MRIILLLAVALAGCGGRTVTPPPPVQVRTVDRVVEVPRPCPAKVPVRPAPLGALPTDAIALAAVLGVKLAEWAGPGKYGDQAAAVIKRCTDPVAAQ